MLNKLRTLLIAEGYYFENEIKDIEHSCCTSCTIKVLDFDKVKDEFCNNIGITASDKLKSVDVMYLSPTENTLYLIEMKSYDPALSVKTADDRLKSLQNKVLDSIFILLSIAGYLNIDKDFYPFFLNPNRLKIKCILLTDLDDKDLLPLILSNQDKLRINLSRRISDPMIAPINSSMFESQFSKLVAS